MIIKNIIFGWFNMCFDKTGVEGTEIKASYLRDVPNDLMQMCEDYLNRKTAICYFDEEDSTATLCLTPDIAYIIFNNETSKLVKLEESPKEIIMILISDMIHHFEDIYTFTPDFEFLSDKEKEKRKESYQNKLNNLSNRRKLAETNNDPRCKNVLKDFKGDNTMSNNYDTIDEIILEETQKAAYEEQCLHDFTQHFAHQE